MDWTEIKNLLSQGTGLHRDALHIYAGCVGLLLAALLMRRTVSDPIPFLAVALMAILNEMFDLLHEVWPSRHDQYVEAVHDLWNTLLLPSLLSACSRFAPGIFLTSAANLMDVSDDEKIG